MGIPKNRPEDMTDFETLINSNNIKYNDRWKPLSVSQFESALSRGAYNMMARELRKNIAYSLQFLEYIQLQFSELKLHDIIATHLVKSYIVTAMGIIEAVFYHLLKSNNLYRKVGWEPYGEAIHTNQFNDSGTIKKLVITTLYKLQSDIETEMDFEAIINKIQDKKLLKISNPTFPAIKHLKRLRNKVHLQIIKHPNDTDYTKISWYDYILARYILFMILSDEIFKQDKDTVFRFIRPSSDQLNKLKSHLRKKQNDKDSPSE